MSTLRIPVCALALATLAWTLPARAAAPSYTVDQATACGSWCYHDPDGTKLTDGITGYAGWAINDAAPWMGWVNQSSVNITFQFSQLNQFSSVQVGSTQDYLGDVVLPALDLWAYQGGNWVLQASIANPASNANNHNAYETGPHPVFDFGPLSFSTDQVRITASATVPGTWIFLDEVSFTASPVPEPSRWAMLVAGLGLAGMARRKATATPR